MSVWTWLVAGMGVVLGIALGALLHWVLIRRHAERKLRLPERWLLDARGLVTSEEMAVWKWLRNAFSDYVVMVKVPVMRFTVPSTRGRPENKEQHWHDLLNGVYCTFTVSNMEGKVVGCVDVPGKRGPTRAQREMKEDLLAACGIGYTTVHSASLPSGNAMRTAFLGEANVVERDAEDTRGGDSSFHAALNDFTTDKVRATKAAAMQELKDKQAAATEAQGKHRNEGFNPDGTGSFTTREKSDRFAVQWDDSFTMPAETRPANLP